VDAKRGDIGKAVLGWYDANARVLPWRVAPGSGGAADPYRVWLSEVMLQQTTVAAVRPRFAAWVARWPDVESLAAADEAEVMAAWAGLGYYARARNLLKAARAVAARGGFPGEEAGLRALPGLGAYTAAAVAAIAFGRRAVVVDANVERVVARLFAIPEKGAAIRAAADAITPESRAGDFAQGMMDLGAGICTVRAPRCLLCPLRAMCAGFASGTPEAFPARKAKAVKPQRFGTVFWLEREGSVLLVRRPDRGLLGGMRALPTGPWVMVAPGLAEAPGEADWRVLDATVAHVFTHFRLELALAVATGEAQVAGEWWPVDRLSEAGLPTVFAKAAAMIGRAR
jgi:A/G-specific adenine glycosylase